MNIDKYIELALEKTEEAIEYELNSDNSPLAKELYRRLFPFYNENEFSGDVAITWKSPSLVKDGHYIGRRDFTVVNNKSIGNLFPNRKTNREFSLNTNRNGYIGRFPHDHFDIFLSHVAKYAYSEEVSFIKEYYPLKRAILYKDNQEFFKSFKTYDDYLEQNYFTEIWNYICSGKCFFDMDFEEFKKESLKLIKCRGKKMIKKLKQQVSWFADRAWAVFIWGAKLSNW